MQLNIEEELVLGLLSISKMSNSISITSSCLFFTRVISAVQGGIELIVRVEMLYILRRMRDHPEGRYIVYELLRRPIH